MIRVIVFQGIATVLATIAACVFFGWHVVLSAALGGLICVLPNLLFAVRLGIVAKFRSNESFQANFLIGGIVKVFSIAILIICVAKGYAGLHWPSFLLGLVMASQAVLFALWKKN